MTRLLLIAAVIALVIGLALVCAPASAQCPNCPGGICYPSQRVAAPGAAVEVTATAEIAAAESLALIGGASTKTAVIKTPTPAASTTTVYQRATIRQRYRIGPPAGRLLARLRLRR